MILAIARCCSAESRQYDISYSRQESFDVLELLMKREGKNASTRTVELVQGVNFPPLIARSLQQAKCCSHSEGGSHIPAGPSRRQAKGPWAF